MDLMDEELRRVLAGSVEPAAPESEFANEMRRLRARDAARPPTASELETASRPSFRTSSPGRRAPEQRGGGEAIDAITAGFLSSIPAGLAGIGNLLTLQGPQKAAEAVRRVQDALALDPETEGGVRAIRGISEAFSPLGVIPQAAGEATLRATGSPLLATGAELMADPLNLLGAGAAARPAARAAAAAGRGAAKAGKATVQSLGPKAAEMAEAYMRRAGMTPEITVYHGSPHVFAPEEGAPLGRFRSEKIGTGEGAQAYGVGTYTAEAPEVAKTYISAGGVKPTSSPDIYAADLVGMMGGEEKAIKHLRHVMPEAGQTTFSGESKDLIESVIKAIESGSYKKSAGNLYAVDLPDPMIEKMLDWDKPLGQQSPDIQKAAQRIAANLDPEARKLIGDSLMNLKGSKLYELLASDDSVAGAGQFGAAASAIMREHGIPGIKYLDEGSRAAGKGTRNFVVFPGEEKNLTILQRNEQRLPQTDTPAFKEFTGGAPVIKADQASKAEFQTGKPVVIEGFSGTRRDFSEIDPALSSSGYFLSSKPVVADEYAGVYPEGMGGGSFPTGGNIQRSFVRMDNPLFVNARGASFNRIDTRGIPGFGLPMSNTDMINHWAKQQGYDGVIYKDLRDSVARPTGQNTPASNVYVSFKPNYVKSAIGNRGTFDVGTTDMTKAQGGAVGGNMSYTQAADVIANKLVGQGVDPDRAMTMALRMSDAHMKAGGAVMMNQGGSPDSFQYTAEESEASDRDMRKYLAEQEIANRLQEKEDRYRRELEGKAQESAANAALAQRFVEQSLSKGAPAATRMRRSWSGPMPNRPVVNGRKMVSAEELADFRRQFGEKMTLRDLLNADRGMGPSATNPAARGQRRAEAPAATTVRSDPYQDPSRVLEGVAASQRAIAAQPGRDAVEGAYPETALVPMRGVMQVARALLAAKPRQEPSMVVEAMRRADLDAVMAGKQPPFYREMQNLTPPGATPPPFRMPPEAPPGALVKLPDGSVRRVPDPNALRRYEPLDVYQRAREVAVDPRVRALEEYFEPTFAEGGKAKPLVGIAPALRGAARTEARLAAKKAAEDAAKAAPAAPSLTGALRPAVEPVRGQTSRELQALQRQQLTPQQKEVFAELRRRYPDFGQAAKFMTPQEVMKVIARPDNAAAMNRLLQTLPSAENLAAVAKAGEPKRGWYRASTQAIIDVFGLQDAPRFSALLAAMSPQTSVEMNLLNTLNTWKNWTAAGRPTDPAKIRQIMGQSVVGTKGEQSVLEAWANNATRALTADDPAKVVLSGPKVDSFYRNLADDVYRVTNDAWMASGLGVGQELFSGSPTALQLQRGDPGLSPGYMGTSARVREAGQRAGILPSEAQETTWSFFMPLYEMQRETGLSAREILQRGLLTPDRIRGTPDFSTLLGQGKYGDILRQAGYEEQLAALKPGEFSTRTADLSLPEQREVEAAAKRLEGLKTMRGAESRSRSISLPPAGQKLQSAFAVEPHEYIPGAGVRLGESMVTAPLGTREHYSSAISSLFRDPMGRDRLQRAVGLNPLPTRAGTGAFRPGGGIPYQGTVRGEATTQRMPVESQPAFASVAEVPVVRGGLDIAQKAKERLGAAAAMRGYLTGQHGSTYNVHIPREGGESFMVQMEGKAEADPMRYTYQLLDDAGYLADTGAGVNVLMNKYKPGNVPFTPQEAADMTAILGGKGFVPGVNVSDYIDYSPAWMGPEGSGAATRELMKRIEPLSKPEKAALSKETQDISGDLYDLFTRKSAKTGDEYRMDVMRALQILRDKGVPGLAAALSAGEALPSEQSGGR